MSTHSLAETVALGRRIAAVQPPSADELRRRRTQRAGIVVLAGGMLAGSTALLVHALRPKPPYPVLSQVGQARLEVPSPLLRVVGQRRGGVQPRLDLAVAWPSLGPVPPAPALAGATARLGPVILVSIAAPADPAEPRSAVVHARFLEPTAATVAGGLIQRRFRAGSPYAGEELYIAPPDGERFSARCETRTRQAEGLPDLCIAELRRGDLALLLRFEPTLLEHWESITSRLGTLVDGFRR